MPNIYTLDIETETSGGFGLDPINGAVRSVSFWSEHETVVFDSTRERPMLIDTAAYLANIDREADVIVTWNGSVFDLPFLSTRAKALQVDALEELLQLTPSNQRPVKYEPLPGHAGGYLARIGSADHADIQWAFKEHADAAGIKHSLKPVGTSFGIDAISVDTENLHLLSRAELIAYNMSDTYVTFELAQRLESLTPWLDSIMLDAMTV